MPQPSEREIEVFNVALELPAAERAAYLDQACAGDAALRQRIEELLQASEEACAFLEDPAAVSPGPGGTIRPRADTHRETRRPHWPLQTAATNRRRRLRRGLHGRAGGTGSPPGRAQGHQAGHGHQEVIARFEAERQALALMDHPNIAKVLDAGATDTGRPYFVMELVRGIKITDYCDQNNLSTRERLDLVHPSLPGHPARAPERASFIATSSRRTSWSR